MKRRNVVGIAKALHDKASVLVSRRYRQRADRAVDW